LRTGAVAFDALPVGGEDALDGSGCRGGRALDGQPAIALPTSGAGLPLITVGSANYDGSQHGEDENVRIQNLWNAIETAAAIMTMKRRGGATGKHVGRKAASSFAGIPHCVTGRPDEAAARRCQAAVAGRCMQFRRTSHALARGRRLQW